MSFQTFQGHLDKLVLEQKKSVLIISHTFLNKSIEIEACINPLATCIPYLLVLI